MSRSSAVAGVRRGTLPVMATACGVMVATVYMCQPLLAQLAHDFGVPARHAALVAVAAQVGYTVGTLFVVPLADVASPRRLIQVLLTITALGLATATMVPSIAALIAATFVFSTTTIVAQILIPLATRLGAPEHRGRIVGALSTGLILGILLARTIAGIVAQYSGTWRAAYGLQACLVVALLLVLPRYMPDRLDGATHTGYAALLRSLVPLLQHRALRLSMALSFCTFAAFSAVWATLAFHLASPAFRLGPAAAGLFGLWGAPGALTAPIAGRLSDRWGPSRVNACSLLSMFACFIVADVLGVSSIAALVVTVNLLDFGQQSGQVANQTRIFGIGESIRGRLNTIYMATTVGGGAVGALTAGLAWSAAGWRGVCLLGGGLVSIAAIVLAISMLGAPSATRAEAA